MSYDLTSAAAILKTVYNKQKMEDLIYSKQPLLGMIKKNENFVGDALKIPVIHGNPVNVSADFTTARAGTTTSLSKAFSITTCSLYGHAVIDNKTMQLARSNEGAFVTAMVSEVDGTIRSLTNSLAQQICRAGWGDVGRLSGAVSGTTLTLSEPEDIVNFEVGDELQFASTQAASALRDSGDSVTVTAVNRAAGTMTVDNLSGISGLADGDWIFKKGNRQDSGTPSRLVLAGLGAWIPQTAPDSTSFFGVDRSIDPTRLGGQRVVASGASVEETILDGSRMIAREGGGADTCFINPSDYHQLIVSLGSKVQYCNNEVKPRVGFRGVLISGQSGDISVHADRNVPAGQGWLLQLDTFVLHSVKTLVHNVGQDVDGLVLERGASADTAVVRLGAYAQLSCNAPGFNCHLTF